MKKALFQGFFPFILMLSAQLCFSGPGFGAGPNSVTPRGHSAPDSLRSRADILFAGGQYGEAAALYRKIVVRDSLNPEVRALLGGCLMRTGQLGEAVEHFTLSVRLDPGIRLCYLGLVYCWYNLGRIDLARSWADKGRAVFSPQESQTWDKMLRERFPLLYHPEEK